MAMARKATEHQEQVTLFKWARFAAARWPELALLHAIPNGGHRHKATAALLKAEGVKRGVPDICLPVSRGGWYGLYIELKAEGGSASLEQRRWIAALQRQGYRAELCKGWEQARRLIEDYMSTSADAGRRWVSKTVPAQGVCQHGNPNQPDA